jgi:long-chain acyl-CoA synthetase
MTVETARSPAGRPSSFLPVDIASGVRAAARRTPNKVALAEFERELTYAQLTERIARVCNGVSGLAPGRVAIMAPNCLEFVEIVLGAALGQAPAAMVNPRNSPEELAFICNDSDARILFVHKSLEEVARSADLPTVERIVVIGGDYETWLGSARPGLVLPAGLEEWDVFCVPYTAGTTGVPKGVMLSHRARALTFYAMAVEYGCYSPNDRHLGVAPLYHGAGFAFSVAALFFGGFCSVLPKFDPELVLKMLREDQMTSTFMVPTHFSAIFALGDEVVAQHGATALKTIICNAAPLPQPMKERIVGSFGEGLLFESYGSTEASIVSNNRPEDQLRKENSVGRPFPCTEVQLLDEAGEPVAAGEVGELYSRSPYLFNGYLGREKDSEAAFRDGWFSAGDLARQDEEGFIYLVDRKSDLIISGGVNIYPKEVEQVLLRHPAVADVAVYGIADDYWGESVKASVVLKPGQEAAQAVLLEYCEGKLARYKQPKIVDFETVLPRNAAGKILKRELRDRHSAQ